MGDLGRHRRTRSTLMSPLEVRYMARSDDRPAFSNGAIRVPDGADRRGCCCSLPSGGNPTAAGLVIGNCFGHEKHKKARREEAGNELSSLFLLVPSRAFCGQSTEASLERVHPSGRVSAELCPVRCRPYSALSFSIWFERNRRIGKFTRENRSLKVNSEPSTFARLFAGAIGTVGCVTCEVGVLRTDQDS